MLPSCGNVLEVATNADVGAATVAHLDWCSETRKAALPHPALVDLVFYFGIDPELLTPDKSGSLKLQKVTALTEQANSRLA
jgi:hypothetical protein